jgi:hypothetical protein
MGVQEKEKKITSFTIERHGPSLDLHDIPYIFYGKSMEL